MADILRQILAAKAAEVALAKRRVSLAALQEQVAARPPARDFTAALRGARPRGHGGEVRILAEIKRKSPSKGWFPWPREAPAQARVYAGGGAAAISVVTDGPFFGGQAEWLSQVREAVELPLLQKDFFLDAHQLWQARVLGADACLLIVAALGGGQLAELLGVAQEAGLHALVEVVDAEEHRRASEAGALLIGVNNRDLRTFSVDAGRTLRLLPCYTDAQVCVAESGLHSAEAVQELCAAGVDAFLIGEALMRSEDPQELLRTLRQQAPSPGGA